VKTVYLHGKLGKIFGKKWDIAASTPREVVLALDANIEGFSQYIVNSNQSHVEYIMLNKDIHSIKSESDFNKNVISEDTIDFKKKNKDYHIIPITQGSGITGFFKLVFATGASGFTFKAVVAKIIFAVAMSYAMAALTKPPEPPKRKDPISTKSYVMSGGRTRRSQGIAVPLGYGRLKVGATGIAESEITRRKESKKDSLLESYSEKEFVDLLCEGPIEGFCNKYGALLSDDDISEGIYLNDVQVRNTPLSITEKGTLNYILNEDMDTIGKPKFQKGNETESNYLTNGVSYVKRYELLMTGPSPYGASNKGNYDASTAPANYSSIQSAKENDAKILSHTISNQFVSEVIFSMAIEVSDANNDGVAQRLAEDKRLRFAILVSRAGREYNVYQADSGCTQVSYDGGAGISNHGEGFDQYFEIDGIATTAYQFDIRVKFDNFLSLEDVGGNWVFKIIKLSPEFDPTVKDKNVGGITRQRNIQFSHVVERIHENLQYTNSAAVHVKVDSKNINRVPERSYHVKMKKILIPSNYDPVNKIYNGPWDGLMKGQEDDSESVHTINDSDKYWSDNPAWILFDLIYNARYGVGKYGLTEESIDKWQLYKIGKYCDELVETDYPIETKSLYPRAFQTNNRIQNNASPPSFNVIIDSREYTSETYSETKLLKDLDHSENTLTDEQARENFIKEFGEGISMAGRKVAFFIDSNSQSYTDSKAQYESAKRDGKVYIEQRNLISSNPDNFSITLEGPPLENEVSRVLQGTVTFQAGEGNLFGSGTLFQDQLFEGAIIKINNSEYTVASILNNTELIIAETFSETVLGSENQRVMITKAIGACANQINHEIVESRFSCNLYLTERREALEVIKNISSVFRAMIAYAGGKIFVIQDALKEPVMMFNNSNVSTEGFSYSGINKNKRITSVLARYNDKNRDFAPSLIYEEDPIAIQKFGYIEKEIYAQGVTSESQARRFAKWILLTSQLETETITFKTGQEGSYLYPGCIFEVADENRMGKSKSGRILDKKTYSYLEDQDSGSELTSSSSSLLIDKFMLDEANLGQVELTVTSPNEYTDFDDLHQNAKFEDNDIDQDAVVDSIFSQQFNKFLGIISYGQGDNGESRQGQNTLISNLKLIRLFGLNFKENNLELYNHNLKTGDAVKFYSGGVLPGGLSKDEKFYVIHATTHSFQVSKVNPLEDDLATPIRIFDVGKDYWGNSGGEHFVYKYSPPGTTDTATKNALKRVVIGAPYSIKGTFDQNTGYNGGKDELSLALGIDLNRSNHGWIESLKFGSIWLNLAKFNGWINSISYNGWIYVQDMLESPDEDKGYFYADVLGWIYFKKANADNGFWWYIVDKSQWIYFERNKFFVYDSSHDFKKFDIIDFLDSGKEATVINYGTDGYWIIFTDYNFYKTIETDESFISAPSIQGLTFENTKETVSYIDRIYDVELENSPQLKKSIRISLFQGHGIDLIANPSLEIRGFDDQTGLNGRWRTVYISTNTFELIDSDVVAENNVDLSLTSTGLVAWTPPPSTLSQRFYERQSFRVLSAKEVADNEFEIAGLEYNSSKFTAVDRKGAVRKPHLPIPPQADMTKPSAPTNLVLQNLN